VNVWPQRDKQVDNASGFAAKAQTTARILHRDEPAKAHVRFLERAGASGRPSFTMTPASRV
jgi:plasmid replication initiation protein